MDNLSIEIQVGGPEGHVEAAAQNQDQQSGVPGSTGSSHTSPFSLEAIGTCIKSNKFHYITL